MNVQPYLELSLLLLVLFAAINDLVSRRIPNYLLLVAWVGVLPLQLLSADPAGGLAACLGGAVTGFAIFMPLYLLRGMAAGDVKLMATVGAFVGPADAFSIAMLSWCAGGVMALLIIVAKGRLRAAFANVGDLLRPLLMRAARMPAVDEPMRQPSVGDAVWPGDCAGHHRRGHGPAWLIGIPCFKSKELRQCWLESIQVSATVSVTTGESALWKR
jgi:prepilin peptidase CpaA